MFSQIAASGHLKSKMCDPLGLATMWGIRSSAIAVPAVKITAFPHARGTNQTEDFATIELIARWFALTPIAGNETDLV
ncbi:hypothetical protein AB1L30_10125 [Bremerella sp. JC817]|uniref:hypothetical protein n=1 Tax=Bremerella sp. JC817 TaxID=3231756 RepID=UPI0034585D55